MKTLTLIISMLAIGLITTAADAHIYTWQDQEGTLHFSNTRPLYDENVSIFLRESEADVADEVSIFLREPEADVADENTSPQIDWRESGEVPAPEAAGSGNLPRAGLEDSIAPVDEMESFTTMEYLSDDELPPAPAADPYAGDSGDGDDDVSKNDREGLYYYLIHKRHHRARPPLYKRHHRDRLHYDKNKRTLRFNRLSRQPGDKRKQVRQRDNRTRRQTLKKNRMLKRKNLTRHPTRKKSRAPKRENLTRRQTGQDPQFKNRRLKSGKSLQGRTRAREKLRPSALKRQSGVPFRRQHQHRNEKWGKIGSG